MKQPYTDEERIHMVKLHLEQGRTIKSLADEFGVAESSIGRWVTKYKNQSLLRGRS